MKPRNLVWVIVVLLVALLAVYLWLHRAGASSTGVGSQKASSGTTAKSEKSLPATSAPPINPQQVVQPPPRGASDAEKWTWWREMSAKDRFFDLKMPISFYGLVVDEQGQPVSGATIKFSWTNLSAKGTSQQSTTSDAAGRFSLTDAVGRTLTVRIEKEGYRIYVLKNRFSFDYAMFADERYHQPDSANPVVFVLRKNREAEPLIFRENQEAELQPGQSKSFAIGPSGAAIVVERLPNTDESPRGWAARVSVPGGGLAFATDEFPFEAPQGGYSPSIEVSNKSPKSPAWSGDNGAQFFVKTPQGYGRVIVRNTPGMAWVYVTSYFNTKPGSRNLEVDPKNLLSP
jgi:hypothetical protein